MSWIVQESCTAFHRAKDTTLAFDTQYLLLNPLLLGDSAHQCFGLMNIQVIQDDVPFAGMRITSTLRLRNIHDRMGGKNKSEENANAQASHSSHPE